MSSEDEARVVDRLLRTTPEGVWPDGFPSSIDPKLILVGVSYGNSPDHGYEDSLDGAEFKYKSGPSAIKDSSSHFFYPDTRKYWEKLRYLAYRYFKNSCPKFTELDALSLVTHINLGTGSAGQASVRDVEENYVQWASCLINEVHDPDVVIFFGLSGILRDGTVSKWWNCPSGISVDWNKPDRTCKFPVDSKNYIFRVWEKTNANGHKLKLVIWPNHPSRPPFGSIDVWQRAVDRFVELEGGA